MDADNNVNDISNGESDYLELPQFGAQYFNLEDAALLAALDEWWLGRGGDDPEFFELVSNTEARKAARPLQQKILKALLKAVKDKELDVKVLARELETGEPVPWRTFAHMSDVRTLLQLYGLGNCHLIEWADTLDDEVYDLALSIYRRRALIKYGLMPIRNEVLGTTLSEQHYQLQQKFDAQSLKIAHLERRASTGAIDTKPLSTIERTTLLKLVIGLAVKGYSYDPAAAKSNATKEIADDLAALGLSITDDTVRKYLKLAAQTVLSSKPHQI